MTERTVWDWPSERADLAPLAERLTPDDALLIVQRLLKVEAELYLAPMLSGLIRGSVARREDEKRRSGGA